ncbi:Bsl7517-like protein [Liberibacter crescens BT-1]|uniref:Bsl7517-like protein n=1 Tax=Liberibacter crescens (strain BT-1) TaxID=1215343 RepID=L0ETQ6_LIBCB|nr:DUF4170 domain-containing protein [Liberibacter crescens]AGA64225.1 Bsl7517-like protein [Liberibacter crescens BT-1]AMC12472.1 inositol monophosphatase [Liberibacter crescens]
MSDKYASEQSLHLVFGGELEDLTSLRFQDTNNIDVVGIFPDYSSAYIAWKAKAHQTVDNAHIRYFIVNIHSMLYAE